MQNETQNKNPKKVSNAAKVAATFHHLRWLKNFYNPLTISKILFPEITYDVLAKRATVLAYALLSDIRIFTEDGAFVGRVGSHQKCSSRWAKSWFAPLFTNTYVSNESVMEGVERLCSNDSKSYFIIGVVTPDDEDDKLHLLIGGPKTKAQIQNIFAEETRLAAEELKKEFAQK